MGSSRNCLLAFCVFCLSVGLAVGATLTVDWSASNWGDEVFLFKDQPVTVQLKKGGWSWFHYWIETVPDVTLNRAEKNKDDASVWTVTPTALGYHILTANMYYWNGYRPYSDNKKSMSFIAIENNDRNKFHKEYFYSEKEHNSRFKTRDDRIYVVRNVPFRFYVPKKSCRWSVSADDSNVTFSLDQNNEFFSPGVVANITSVAVEYVDVTFKRAWISYFNFKCKDNDGKEIVSGFLATRVVNTAI